MQGRVHRNIPGKTQAELDAMMREIRRNVARDVRLWRAFDRRRNRACLARRIRSFLSRLINRI